MLCSSRCGVCYFRKNVSHVEGQTPLQKVNPVIDHTRQGRVKAKPRISPSISSQIPGAIFTFLLQVLNSALPGVVVTGQEMGSHNKSPVIENTLISAEIRGCYSKGQHQPGSDRRWEC